MHVERLTKLAELLERPLPKGAPKFDMSTWYQCGTRACAAGHAALDPWFRRRGLKLVKLNDPRATHEPSYEGKTGFDALALFFDLDAEAADEIFMTHDVGNSRRDVARRIRRLIREGS